MRFGIQLSSFQRLMETEADVRETFSRLAGAGFRVSQAQWIGKGVSREAVKSALDDAGLACAATQDYYDAIAADFEGAIADAKLWGAKYVCVSGVPARYLQSDDGIAAFARELERRAAALGERGLALAFHPRMSEYKYLERIMSTAPSIYLTIDIYHALGAGLSPLALLARWAGRVDSIHMKDADDSGALVAPGEGATDWPAIFSAALEAGVACCYAEHEGLDADGFGEMLTAFEFARALGLDV